MEDVDLHRVRRRRRSRNDRSVSSTLVRRTRWSQIHMAKCSPSVVSVPGFSKPSHEFNSRDGELSLLACSKSNRREEGMNEGTKQVSPTPLSNPNWFYFLLFIKSNWASFWYQGVEWGYYSIILTQNLHIPPSISNFLGLSRYIEK